MKTSTTLLRSATTVLGLTLAANAPAADYFVPSVVHPTLAAAIAAASASVDADNTIWITDSPIIISGTAYLGLAFGPGRRLTIRPTEALGRATIASNNSGARIFWLDGAGYVTLQDLDIVRNITNAEDLVVLNYHDGFYPAHIVIQRCRIGSIWTVPGAPGFACLRIQAPVEVVVRNCIFFAYFPGTLDRGVWANGFGEPINSLFLYNNVVADHRLAGIRVDDDGGADGSLVILRNNVVSNHPALDPEPYGYVSFVDDLTRVVTSHNAVFATAGFGEFVGFGAVSVAGVGGGTFLGFPRAAADAAFVNVTWDLDPAWDPNPDFWRLEFAGPLHDAAVKYGQNVGAGSPDPRDYAVVDDIEGDIRPGGTTLHTDRGADQIEPGSALAVGPGSGAGLWAAPLRNPARTPELAYRVDRAGRLSLEVHDLAGRKLHAAERWVSRGDAGTLAWPGRGGSGVLFYRVRLEAAEGGRSDVRGRVVLIE